MSALYFIRNCEAVPTGAALSVRYLGEWQRCFYVGLNESGMVQVTLERNNKLHDAHVTSVHGVMIRSR